MVDSSVCFEIILTMHDHDRHDANMKWAKLILHLIVYMGVGLFCVAQNLGPTFQPDNMYTWAWLTAWPVCLMILHPWPMILVVIACVVCMVFLFALF